MHQGKIYRLWMQEREEAQRKRRRGLIALIESLKQQHTSRNCRSSPLTVHSLTTAFNTPEGESWLNNLTGVNTLIIIIRHWLLRVELVQPEWRRGYVLSSDLSAVPRGPREHHRLVVVEHDVLPAKVDVFLSLQITLAPLCRRERVRVCARYLQGGGGGGC